MNKTIADQADGLRRLLAHAPTRIVAVAGMAAGMGATTVAMNLATALVHQGRGVLLLDEHCPTAESACAIWAIDPEGTLADLFGALPGSRVAASKADCGVSVLPAPPSALPADADPRLLCGGGVILIDAAFDGAGHLSPLAQRADELVVVLQPGASSITSTYAGLKRLHYAHGLQQFRLLANGVASGAQAEKIMTNLVSAGTRYLAVSLQSAGWVRADAHMMQARRLSRTVTEAYPASAAAVDFRRVAVEMGQWPWDPTRADLRPACRPDNDSVARLPAARGGSQPQPTGA